MGEDGELIKEFNDGLPEPTAEDRQRAARLANLEYLDADGLRKTYRQLSASFYALERGVRELQATNARLRDALEKVEYDREGFCPLCNAARRRDEQHRHAPGCAIHAGLRE